MRADFEAFRELQQQNALPTLADEAILLLGRVLLHAPTAEVLKPENLARAFGLGTEREGDLA